MKIQTYELARIPVPDITLINDKTWIDEEFKSIFLECGLDPKSSKSIFDQNPDPVAYRKALDSAIFRELELTKDEQIEVYRSLCSLVWDRLSKAQSM